MSYSISSLSDGCYPGTTVLINKLALTDQGALDDAERVAVILRSTEVECEPCTKPFSFDFYCSLHKRLFGDIYDWAGQLRTIDFSKQGTSFYPASELPRLGKARFEYLKNANEFKGLPPKTLAAEIARFYHELNMLHPFREGNGRTERLFISLLLRRLGYEINFAQCDTELLMIATIYAAQGVISPLQDFFENILCGDKA